MKSVVIGASGQTGSLVSKLLVGEGHKVFAASRNRSYENFWRFNRLEILQRVDLVTLDCLNPKAVRLLFESIKPDFVFFLGGPSSVGASFSHPETTFQSITYSVLNLLEAARQTKSNARIFNASSTDSFGDQTGRQLNEGSCFAPVSPYGVAKVAAHNLVVNYRDVFGLNAVSGILTNHESPLRGPEFVIPKIVTALRGMSSGSAEELTLGDTSVVRDWMWAPDAARAIWHIARSGLREDFVVGTGESHSLDELIVGIAYQLGVSRNPLYTHSQDLRRKNEIPSVQTDPTALTEKTGWKPSVGFEGLVERLADWKAERLAD